MYMYYVHVYIPCMSHRHTPGYIHSPFIQMVLHITTILIVQVNSLN